MKPDEWKDDPVRIWTRRIMATMLMASILIVWFVIVVKFIELTLL